MGRKYQANDLAQGIAMLADHMHWEDWDCLSPGIGVGAMQVVNPHSSFKTFEPTIVPNPVAESLPPRIAAPAPLTPVSGFDFGAQEVAAGPMVEEFSTSWAKPLASRQFAAKLKSQKPVSRSERLVLHPVKMAPPKRVSKRPVIIGRLVARVASSLADLGLVVSSSLFCIGGGWVLLGHYLKSADAGPSESTVSQQFWQWLTYFKTAEIIASLVVLFALYQFIFRWLVGRTLGQMMFSIQQTESVATTEGISGKFS